MLTHVLCRHELHTTSCRYWELEFNIQLTLILTAVLSHSGRATAYHLIELPPICLINISWKVCTLTNFNEWFNLLKTGTCYLSLCRINLLVLLYILNYNKRSVSFFNWEVSTASNLINSTRRTGENVKRCVF